MTHEHTHKHRNERARTACAHASGSAVKRPIGGTEALQQNGELASHSWRTGRCVARCSEPDD